jgi:hypothetical protein
MLKRIVRLKGAKSIISGASSGILGSELLKMVGEGLLPANSLCNLYKLIPVSPAYDPKRLYLFLSEEVFPVYAHRISRH